AFGKSSLDLERFAVGLLRLLQASGAAVEGSEIAEGRGDIWPVGARTVRGEVALDCKRLTEGFLRLLRTAGVDIADSVVVEGRGDIGPVAVALALVEIPITP